MLCSCLASQINAGKLPACAAWLEGWAPASAKRPSRVVTRLMIDATRSLADPLPFCVVVALSCNYIPPLGASRVA